jgi:hypothetical protein
VESAERESSEATALDPGVGQALFADAVDRYLRPELKTRVADGRLATGTEVLRFQVLFRTDGGPEVRVNEEVGGTVSVQPAGAMLSPGQEVAVNDVASVSAYELRPEDAGLPHLTAFAHLGGWSLVFNFGVGHPRRNDFLTRAHEFVATAREAASAGRLGPFVDNAYSACELLAKAELLSSQPTVELVLESGSHGAIATPYHAWAKLGNTDQRFARLLKRLAELRGPGRYLDHDLALERASIDQILDDLTVMEEHVTDAVRGKTVGTEFQEQTFFAKRPLRAGQLVTTEDVTIFPPKKRKELKPE